MPFKDSQRAALLSFGGKICKWHYLKRELYSSIFNGCSKIDPTMRKSLETAPSPVGIMWRFPQEITNRKS